MKSLVLGAVLGFGATAFLTRYRGGIAFGSVVLDDAYLEASGTQPRTLTVLGLVDITPTTSTELLATRVAALNVFGLLVASPDATKALAGRVRVTGTINTRD